MDEHGKPIVGKTVQFDILGGGGRLSAKTVATDARGKARVTLTLGSSQGVNKVKAIFRGHPFMGAVYGGCDRSMHRNSSRM